MVAVGLLVSRHIMSLGTIQFLLRENQKLVRISMNVNNKELQPCDCPNEHSKGTKILYVQMLIVSGKRNIYIFSLYIEILHMYIVHVKHISCSGSAHSAHSYQDICNKLSLFYLHRPHKTIRSFTMELNDSIHSISEYIHSHIQ